MATVTTLVNSTNIGDDMSTINTNFTNLNNDKLEAGDNIGTPSAGVATNLTGTASGLTAGSVTTNANLTGHVTSTGNAAILGSFTKAQLDAAVSDDNILYDSELTSIASVKAMDQGVAAASSPTFVGQTLSGLTASEIVATDGSKALQSLAVATYPSLAELAYVKGVTSAIQTQFAAKASIQRYEMEYISAGAMLASATGSAASGTKDDGTNVGGFDYFAFDGAANEDLFFDWAMPDDWDLGTIKVKFLWIPQTGCTAADGVTLELSAVAVGDDDAWDATMGTAVHVDDTVHVGVEADQHTTAATAAITVGGTPALGDITTFRIQRLATDAADTMLEEVWLRGIQIQYRTLTTETAAW